MSPVSLGKAYRQLEREKKGFYCVHSCMKEISGVPESRGGLVGYSSVHM